MKKKYLFLVEHYMAYQFYDYKKIELTKEIFSRRSNQLDYNIFINTSGTFKNLTDDDKLNIKSRFSLGNHQT